MMMKHDSHDGSFGVDIRSLCKGVILYCLILGVNKSSIGRHHSAQSKQGGDGCDPTDTYRVKCPQDMCFITTYCKMGIHLYLGEHLRCEIKAGSFQRIEVSYTCYEW